MMKSVMVLMALMICMTACGGGEEPGPVQDPVETAAVATPEDAALSDLEDPGALADAILADYSSAYSELAALVAGDPPAAELRPRVEALKSRYIETFMGLGVYYEGMDASARAVVDSRVSAGFGSLDMDHFEAVSNAVSHYRAEDTELADLLTDFNIITQYAFYDLLRSQEPEEAARLGL